MYSVASLQHVPKPFVCNLFFEIKRFLAPKGFSLLHLIGFNHIPHCCVPWPEIVRNQVKEGERFSPWIHFYTAEELRWVLGPGTGFTDVRVVEKGEALAVALRN